MMKRSLGLVICIVALGVRPAIAQESGYSAELSFVRELRARHYTDLALDYLERLRKSRPSPELLKELPLELAKTRLEAAADEPDSGKRLALYDQARGELEAFLSANAEHARAAEAKLDVAQVIVLQGKTQLSRALSADTPEARVADGRKARVQFEEAAKRLKSTAAEIDALLSKLGEPGNDADKARQKKLVADRQQAKLAVALNLLDQAYTYLDTNRDAELEARGKLVQESARLLEQLAGTDVNSSVSWQAAAWLGRSYQETGEPKKARARFAEVLATTGPAGADGRRLARYFKLLVQQEAPEEEEKRDLNKLYNQMIADASSWLTAYPSYVNTPEGNGIRFLLAQTLQRHAALPKVTPAQKISELNNARGLLRGIEQTENDFTDQARRQKISLMQAQKLFDVPIASLKTFEDCFVRAQFEMQMMTEDAKGKEGAKPDEKQLEELRKKRRENVVSALVLGLQKSDAWTRPGVKSATPVTWDPATGHLLGSAALVGFKPSQEVNTARAMLPLYCLTLHRYDEAIRFGEAFARDDPRSGQAAMAAMYALQAYGEQLGNREQANASPEEIAPERGKMLSLARYMEERWPKEVAGDLARHKIGLMLLQDKKKSRDAAEQSQLLADALAKLGSISRAYPSYIVAQYQMAEACLQAEADKLDNNDKSGAFRQRAVAVLTALPEPDPSAESFVYQAYVLGKARLGWELLQSSRPQPALDLADGLLKKLPTTPLEEEARAKLQSGLTELKLYSLGRLADAEFKSAKYAEVAARIDPLAVAMNASQQAEHAVLAAQMKKSLQMASALLSMDLRANVQLGKLDQVEVVLKAMQALTADTDEKSGTAKILQTLVFVIKQQIDELDRKGDAANRAKATEGFTKLLGKVVAKPDDLDMNSRLLLAQCYSNMNEHKKAADLLEKVASPEEKSAQFIYARELRLSKELDRAREVLNTIIAPKTGWGAKNVDALLEDVALLEDEGKFQPAALKADKLVKQLLPSITRDNSMKEKYFDAYYHVVFCFVKFGQGLSDKEKKDKTLRQAALQAVELEKKWPNFGGDVSARRFNDLLAKEPDFKDIVDQIRASNK